MQGYVTFYDLSIDGHPSYFANGSVVHNCHKSTSDYQNAILKILEDTPGHAYFILCTTDPGKLLLTVRNRCQQFQIEKPGDDEMISWLNDICEKENIAADDKGIVKLIDVADNCPRQALILLEKVKAFGSFSKEAIASVLVREEEQVINLCRRLLSPSCTWKSIAPIIAGIQEEPESVRYAILGYMTSVLLKDDNPRAALVIDYFKDNFYDSKRAGLVHACYMALPNQ